jgi:hypothetical protein
MKPLPLVLVLAFAMAGPGLAQPANAATVMTCTHTTWTWEFRDAVNNPTRVTLGISAGTINTVSANFHNTCAGGYTGSSTCVPGLEVCECTNAGNACVFADLFWSGQFGGTWFGSCTLLTVSTDNGFTFTISPLAGTIHGSWNTNPFAIQFAGTFVSTTLNPCDMPAGMSVMAAYVVL